MGLVLRTEVTPYNAQIELRAKDCDDYPEWTTGEEAVVGLPNCVAVATQGDDQGNVEVEVWQGNLKVEDPSLSQALYDAQFVASDAGVVVGNTVGNELYPVPSITGVHRLKVFASPAGGLAKKVYFLID